MLHGAGMSVKFWPYAFHHYIWLKNSLPVCGKDKSPLSLATGKVDDFTGLWMFGCQVWVCPPGCQDAKFIPNSRKGLFLGYLPNTAKNILWYNVKMKCIKITKHALFDEGMNDLPFNDIPLNIQHLT
jgi:hypothetical protein